MLPINNNSTYFKWEDPYEKTNCACNKMKRNCLQNYCTCHRFNRVCTVYCECRDCYNLESLRAGCIYANNPSYVAAVARDIRLSLKTAQYSKNFPKKNQSELDALRKDESRCNETSAGKNRKRKPEKCGTKKMVGFSAKYKRSYDVKKETAALKQNKIEKVELQKLDGCLNEADDQIKQPDNTSIEKN